MLFTGSEDLSDTRNLVEEIHMRTQQLPLTKQDSYANAIYNSATRAQQARKGGLRKQGIENFKIFLITDIYTYLEFKIIGFYS